jgi:hypothetical protein
MTSLKTWLAFGMVLTTGLAAGAWGRGLWPQEPGLVRVIDRHLGDQTRQLEKQELALETLTASINELRRNAAAVEADPSLRTAGNRAPTQGGSQNAPAEDAVPKQGSVQVEAVRAGEGARDEAFRLVDRAASLGSWSDKDASEFRSLLALMMPAQRDEAQHALFKALNEGHVRLAARGPY